MRQKFGHTCSFHLAFVASCSRRRGPGKRTAFESSSPDTAGETLSSFSLFWDEPLSGEISNEVGRVWGQCTRDNVAKPQFGLLRQLLVLRNSTPFSMVQKLNFKANWIIRGLLLVEMMRPKLPAFSTCPVVGSILPPEARRAFRLLMGLAKLE